MVGHAGLPIKRFEVKIPVRAEICFKISTPPAPSPSNSDTMSTLTIHCQWEDEMVMERTGHPPSHAEA